MTGKNITRVSLSDLKGMKGRTRPDAPEGEELGAAFWDNATVVEPQGKKSVHLRIDADIYEYFKSQGKGHLTRMNAVLRSYVNAKQSK